MLKSTKFTTMPVLKEENKVKVKGQCQICGKPSTRTHFGAMTCGGCRAFHKRAVKRKTGYVCSADGCSSLVTGKTRCKACRFRKYEELIGKKKHGLDDSQKIPCLAENLEAQAVSYEDGEDVQTEKEQLVSSTEMSGSEYSASTDSRRSSYDLHLIPNWSSLDDQTRKTVGTMSAVGNVVHDIWGESIDSWTANRDRAMMFGSFGQEMKWPDTNYDELVATYNFHIIDNSVKGFNFAARLPGARDLEPSTIRRCIAEGWKKLVYWVIHHAVFMNEFDSYVTVGPNQLHYGRAFHETVVDRRLVDFIYKLCNEFRDIGLNEVERYMMMVIVMFEMGDDQPLHVKAIHRHYARVLLELLKQRCSDTEEFLTTCRKLELFFSSFRTVERMHTLYSDNYLRVESRPTTPVTYSVKETFTY